MKKVFLAFMAVALMSVASDVSARGGKNKKSAAKPAVAAQAAPAVAAKKQPQYANKAAKKAAKQQRKQARKQASAAQTQAVKH